MGHQPAGPGHVAIAAPADGQTSAPIDNPIINSPFVEPARHFSVVDGQVTGAIEEGRRPSEFFVPVRKPRKATRQLALRCGNWEARWDRRVD